MKQELYRPPVIFATTHLSDVCKEISYALTARLLSFLYNNGLKSQSKIQTPDIYQFADRMISLHGLR